MIYAIIHRPKINDTGIEEFRKKHDPNFKLIGPHVTLVFPFKADNIVLSKLEAHIEKIAKQIKPFKAEFRELKLAWDQWLILTPTAGKKELELIHNELYAGMLKKFLRADIEFIPHISLGHFAVAGSKYDFLNPAIVPLDEEKYKTAISELEGKNFDFIYTVDTIELISATDEFIASKTLKVFNLK